jgi:hypothetical protein
MASRYHWVQAGFQTSWSGTTVLPAADVVIPAGATMKRFVVSNFAITGKTVGSNQDTLQPIYCDEQVKITTNPYLNHILYDTTRMVPVQSLSTMVTELGIGYRIYTQIVSAGDLELGINEKTSYGKIGGAAFTVRFQASIFPKGPTPSLASGAVKYNFRALYYL